MFVNEPDEPTSEQIKIIEAEHDYITVIACAGSGKTRTAVNRIIEKSISSKTGDLALLSLTNIAVSAFQRKFSSLTKSRDSSNIRNKVYIETIDSFITKNLIRPHAKRVMQSKKPPFLLSGNEEFLKNNKYRFWVKPKNKQPIPVGVNDLFIDVVNDKFAMYARFKNTKFEVENWRKPLNSLAETGGYTHELAKYWALQLFLKEKKLIKITARRFPNIIVDEAQDIDTLHWYLLDALKSAGSKITLIGDPNQAIYEFKGADGSFLNQFAGISKKFSLSKNFRSIESIVNVSRVISKQKQSHVRIKQHDLFGAYYLTYKTGDEKSLVEQYSKILTSLDISKEQSAVLIRGKSKVLELTNDTKVQGQGLIQYLAKASILQSKHQHYNSYKLVVNVIFNLINNPPPSLKNDIIINPCNIENKLIVKHVWKFIRDSKNGLPSPLLKAKTEWHPLVKTNVTDLLETICGYTKLNPVNNVGRRLAKTGLSDEPLLMQSDSITPKSSVTVDTVHQFKGETLSSCCYIATKRQVNSMLNGTDTEEGRIGYVALTRARDLFILAVPETGLKELEQKLKNSGFAPWR